MGCSKKGIKERRSTPKLHWSEGEADTAAFSDVRLGRRFAELLRRFGDRIGATIPFACPDWANTKAAYRFFANPNVEEGRDCQEFRVWAGIMGSKEITDAPPPRTQYS